RVGRGLVAAADALVDFLAVHGHVLGRGDADPHLVPLHAENGDGDRIADHQGFADAAGQNQHLEISIGPRACCRKRRPSAGPQRRFNLGKREACPGRAVRSTDIGHGANTRRHAALSLAAAQAGTSARTCCSCGPSSPPPWAMSGRPPPLPPMAPATKPTRSPARTRPVALPDTAATRAARPSLAPASTITASPSCCRRRSIASRSALASSPSTRAASTFTPATSTARLPRSAVAPLASRAL